MNNNLISNLIELREKHGWTQQFVADQLNVDRTSYNKYEKGQTAISIQTLIRLSDIYSVTLDEIVGRNSRPLMVADNPPAYEAAPPITLTQSERARVLKIRQLDAESLEMIDKLIAERLDNLD